MAWQGIIALITGVMYVWLAAKNNPWCWVWGIISSALLGYLSYFSYKLYADAFLQGVYIVMGIIGLYQWRMARPSSNQTIKRLGLWRHALIIIMGISISFLSGYILKKYSTAFATYIDSFTTVFGLIATVLLIQRYIGNWVYWIVIDVIMAFLYYHRGQQIESNEGYSTAILMLVYTVVSVYGYISWRHIQAATIPPRL